MKNLRFYFGFASTLFMFCQISVMAQSGICKADRATFVAGNPLIQEEYRGKEYKEHFDKIVGSLGRFFANIALSKLNANATADEIADYLGCVTDNDRYVPVRKREKGGQENEYTNAPAAFIFHSVDPPQAIVATYPVVGHPNAEPWGIAPSRPIVQCFVKKDAQWSFVGELGDDFRSSTLSVYQLNSPVPGEIWILLAGRAIGSPDGTFQLQVATCDGKAFTKKWAREKILQGEIEEVSGNTVLLTYEKLDERGRVVFFPTNHIRYSEVLHVTPNGLE